MKRVFVIAEAGVNHNGSLEKAKELIDVAAEAGADAVKFQTFKTELSIAKAAPKAAYQTKNTGSAESQYEMVKKLELSYDQFRDLKKHCDLRRIEFMSTPFDFPSVDFLAGLDMRVFKIASGEATNLPLLRKIGRLNKTVIASTGMCTIPEIQAMIRVLVTAGTSIDKISILHCNTEYPTPPADVNLNAMAPMRAALNVDIGYSDHTKGIAVPIAAVACGATVIEKHFTLDRSLPGPDHIASIEPQELRDMVAGIRTIEAAMGGTLKTPSPSETKNIAIARKSIVASRPIKSGELFSDDNLGVKRPGTGVSPMKWDDVIGKTARRNFHEDEMIEL